MSAVHTLRDEFTEYLSDLQRTKNTLQQLSDGKNSTDNIFGMLNSIDSVINRISQPDLTDTIDLAEINAITTRIESIMSSAANYIAVATTHTT